MKSAGVKYDAIQHKSMKHIESTTQCESNPKGMPLAKYIQIQRHSVKSSMMAAQPGEPSLPKRLQCFVCPAGSAHAIAVHLRIGQRLSPVARLGLTAIIEDQCSHARATR